MRTVPREINGILMTRNFSDAACSRPFLRGILLLICVGILAIVLARHYAFNPVYSDVFVRLGEESRNKGRWDKAQKYFLRAVRLDPANARAYVGLGLSALQKGHRDQALKYIRKAANMAPEDHGIQNTLGEVYLDLGYVDRALHAFQAAIHVEGNYRDVGQYHYNLGRAYLRKGETQRVIGEIEAMNSVDRPDLAQKLQWESQGL